MHSVIAIALALALGISTGVWGDASVNVGAGKILHVPVPDGFAALGDSDPSFREFVARARGPGHRFLEIFLSRQDFQALTSGSNPPRNRMLSMDLVESEQGDLWTVEGFQRYVRVIHNMDMDHPDRIASAIQQLYADKQASGAELPPASKPIYLGLVIDQPNAVGVMRGMVVNDPAGTDRQIISNTYVYVKGRMIVLNLSAHGRGDDDVRWVRETSKMWATKLLATNGD
ncbi:hypothetical protein [Dyella sp. C11]|uniref:hypothetical protein n=1 Tax=Dyella sp. C11 TaxID=2126991 RepID=UPI001300BAD8|nr:hypothetical protein [Dyella sp. C11]